MIAEDKLPGEEI